MITRPTIYPETVKFELRVFGQRGHAHAQAVVRYLSTIQGDTRELSVVLTPATVHRQRRHLWGGTMVLADSDGERRLVNFLSWFRGKWFDDRYSIDAKDELPFLLEGVPRAQGAGVDVSVDPSLRDIMSDRQLRVSMDLAVKSGGFALWTSPMAGEEHVDIGSVLEAKKQRRRWVSSDGKVIKVDEDVDLELLAETAERARYYPWSDKGRLANALRLVRDARIDDGMRPVIRRVLQSEPDDKPPESIRATFRPYQLEGVKWLRRAISSGSGGVLADQPGLGKTLQSISAFVAMKDNDPSFRVIVFAPKSLMGNWMSEFNKFSPTTNVLVWEGPQRKKYEEMIPKMDAIIISYDTYKRDYELINRYPFHLAIFDEAQVLKNADTASHKAAVSCLAPVRIALTGTPIENRLDDLHSILSIASPGALPPRKEFSEKIAKPFREGDTRAVALMTDQIKPMILRRTKDLVLTDLPEKTIIDQKCPMVDSQEQFYAESKEWAKRERDAAIASGDKARMNGLYLKLLTRLRQIATDPRLAEPGKYRAEDSGKMMALRLMMDQFEQNEDKVLIFSQWVECLNLVKLELEERKERFSYLTGETKNRDEQVHDFQNRSDIRYFLLGLKSGGVGLNMTAANTVVFMDPWWNPAAENQAMDRAHRFGQKRNVTVYRMISAGTVEEKIAEMKAIKQAISNGVIDDQELPEIDDSAKSRLLD